MFPLIMNRSNTMPEMKQAFVTADGTVFDTKKEAQDYLRKPMVRAELMKLTNSNIELTDWLIENQETVEVSFESGTIRRITKADQKKLDKALEVIKEACLKGTEWLIENYKDLDFKYKLVKRMDSVEKAAFIVNTLTIASSGNTDLANWVIAHKAELLECYAAGIQKRVISPKAVARLAEYRAKMAAEKASKLEEA